MIYIQIKKNNIPKNYNINNNKAKKNYNHRRIKKVEYNRNYNKQNWNIKISNIRPKTPDNNKRISMSKINNINKETWKTKKYSKRKY